MQLIILQISWLSDIALYTLNWTDYVQMYIGYLYKFRESGSK